MSGPEKDRRPGRRGGRGRGSRGARVARIGRGARVVVGAVLVAASVAALGALTRYRHVAEPERAELRLVWRTPVPRVVECREPTESELAELPVHMQQGEICEGQAVEYRLEVRVDGVVRHRSLNTGAGARGDRPLRVFETLPLEPGERHVRVVFERADSVQAADAMRGAPETGSGARSPVAESQAGAMELPARLVLDRRLEVGVREVVLITYDRDGGRLVSEQGPDGQEA